MEPSTPNSPDSMGIATEEPQKILGRKKIKIQRIEDDRNRQVSVEDAIELAANYSASSFFTTSEGAMT